MNINPNRPVEDLIGDNRGIMRQKLGRIHCCTSIMNAARETRPRNMRALPVELRRGWVKCIADTLAEYRSTFYSVVNARECVAQIPSVFE